MSAWPATAAPRLSSTLHGLRTMWRWCGIIVRDQSLGAFSRAWYAGETSAS